MLYLKQLYKNRSQYDLHNNGAQYNKKYIKYQLINSNKYLGTCHNYLNPRFKIQKKRLLTHGSGTATGNLLRGGSTMGMIMSCE